MINKLKDFILEVLSDDMDSYEVMKAISNYREDLDVIEYDEENYDYFQLSYIDSNPEATTFDVHIHGYQNDIEISFISKSVEIEKLDFSFDEMDEMMEAIDLYFPIKEMV